MNSAAAVWTKVLSLLEEEMTPTTIKTWFDDVRLLPWRKAALSFVLPTPSIVTSFASGTSPLCKKHCGNCFPPILRY